MKSREFAPNQKYAKSYESETAMLKAIQNYGFEKHRFVRHTFEDGRITPVFIWTDKDVDPIIFADANFAVIG